MSLFEQKHMDQIRERVKELGLDAVFTGITDYVRRHYRDMDETSCCDVASVSVNEDECESMPALSEPRRMDQMQMESSISSVRNKKASSYNVDGKKLPSGGFSLRETARRENASVYGFADLEECTPKKMTTASFLDEKIKHLKDTFSQNLIYLIDSKGYTDPEVYKRAYVDKKAFNKIKNNVDAHPSKETALKLCIGLKLNLDESKDFLSRAGYAFSPSSKTDIIFSYFIETQNYDMIELSIVLEEFGEPCLIA